MALTALVMVISFMSAFDSAHYLEVLNLIVSLINLVTESRLFPYVSQLTFLFRWLVMWIRFFPFLNVTVYFVRRNSTAAFLYCLKG